MVSWKIKFAKKTEDASKKLESSIKRSVGKGDVQKILKEAMPEKSKTTTRKKESITTKAKKKISSTKAKVIEKEKDLEAALREDAAIAKKKAAKNVSKAKSAVKEKVGELRQEAVQFVGSKTFEAFLLGAAAVVGPEGPLLVEWAKELGIIDALLTLNFDDWTIDARKLKFPVETPMSGPIAGYNKQTGRIKITSIFGASIAPINPYYVYTEVKSELGIKTPEPIDALFAFMGFVVVVLQAAPTVLLEGFQGHGFHYPGSNYIGPGTPVDEAGPPQSEMDALARIHDIQYNYLQELHKNPYKTFNMADRYMLARVKLQTPEGWAILLSMNAKRVFNEDKTPIPPIPSYAETSKQKDIPQSQAWKLNNPQRLLTYEEVTLSSKPAINHPAHADVGSDMDPEDVLQHQTKILVTKHPDPESEQARQQHMIGLSSNILNKMS